MNHPNLYFSRQDVENYKKKIKTDPAARSRYESAVAKTDEYLNEELYSEQRINDGGGLHADFGLINQQINRFCDSLGLKYLVEGDTRCAEKIKKTLLHYITFERWFSKNYTVRTPVPWHADLCSTAATIASGYAYDIIYDYLTPEERKTIAEGILNKGVLTAFADWVLPESRIHALDSMGHNWWSVCIAEPATALLALSDELPGEAERLLSLADEALSDYLTYPGNRLFNKLKNFDSEGLFYESLGYNNYGTGSLLRYLWCRERIFGRNDTIRNALPDGLADATMCQSYPVNDGGKIRFDFFNFGDSTVQNDFSFFAKYAYRLGLASDALKALLATYATDLREEIGGLKLDGLNGSLDGLPLTKVYPSGFAVARNSYEPDSTALAVKCGFCWNHSHNDSGTFIIFSGGKPLFIDSGTCIYDSPLYHSYYCQDRAHSVLTVGGEGRRDEELYRGTKFPGALTDSFTGGDYFFVQADSTGPMAHLCSRMFRNFFWLDNRVLVIFDDVFLHGENTVSFTVHADGEFRNEGNTVLFDNGATKAKLTGVMPAMIYSTATGHTDHAEKVDVPFAVLTTAETGRTHTLIHTIELGYEENPAQITKADGKGYSGIIIEDGKKIRGLYYNHMADGHVMHDNSNNVIAGYDTDAYMLMETTDKETGEKSIFIVCGSYLRKDGRVLFSSFVKKTEEIRQ